MAIVGTGQDRTSNQLPAWTSNRFAVFLERDPAGLPPHLDGKVAPPPQGSRQPGTNASLEMRFFFDIGTIGSSARRKVAPNRTWGTHARRCPDVDGRDWTVPFPAETAVFYCAGSVIC